MLRDIRQKTELLFLRRHFTQQPIMARPIATTPQAKTTGIALGIIPKKINVFIFLISQMDFKLINKCIYAFLHFQII